MKLLSHLNPIRLGIERLSVGLSWLSALLLLLLVILTVIDVGFRYLVSNPIRGAHEMTEILMLGIVLLALAFCEMRGGHIRVDVLDEKLGAAGRRITDLFSAAVGMIVVCAMAWRAYEKAIDAWEFGDASSFLQIPLWPHYGLVAFGMLTYALTLVARALSGEGAQHE